MKTINVTDEMYNFLMDLSKELNTQDHRCTAMPYFFQIQTKKQVAAYDGCGTDIWVDEDGNELETEDEIREFIAKDIYENDESIIYLDDDKAKDLAKKKVNEMDDWDLGEYLESHRNNWRKVAVTTENEYKNAFLTEKACKAHIKANNYHYSEPRDYLTHAFRNPELEKVLQFLCELTNGKLHK